MYTMDTKYIFACLLVLFTATSSVKTQYYSKTHIIKTPDTMKETHLHFFLHNTISGKNPSAVLIAKPNGTIIQDGNVNPFGAVYVFDDPLTVGPSLTSEVIGNARGLYASVSRGSDSTLLFNGDLEFTSGEFNGSSISVFSRDQLVPTKELAVIGGRGKFRMAKGFVISNVIFSNISTGDAIFEIHVTIFYQ